MKEFIIYSYHGVCDDWYAVDGNKMRLTASLQTEENTKLYKDAGFNLLFVNYVFEFNALEERFAESKLKKVMDTAHAHGLKCFVHECNLFKLSASNASLIDKERADGKRIFASEKELDAFVSICAKEISEHPAFYGFTLKDEPSYEAFTALGQVYRAIKKLLPNAFVNINLLPIWKNDGFQGAYCENGTELPVEKAYELYLQQYRKLVGSPILQYDDYPLRGDGTIKELHLVNLKIAAEFCKAQGMILYKVFQTCAIDTPLGHANRKPTAAELLWQINLGMAFGVKGYTYWTYYPVVNSLYEYYDETACFVDREGKPNETYFIMQKLHKEMQDTAKELAGFDYVGAQIVKNAPVGNYNLYLENFDGDGLTLLKGVSVNEGTALLVSELYDGEKGRYGYFFVNATDPIENRSQTVTAEFLKEKRALVYRNGKASFVDFVAGRYEFILGTGEGIFVIPQ